MQSEREVFPQLLPPSIFPLLSTSLSSPSGHAICWNHTERMMWLHWIKLAAAAKALSHADSAVLQRTPYIREREREELVEKEAREGELILKGDLQSKITNDSACRALGDNCDVNVFIICSTLAGLQWPWCHYPSLRAFIRRYRSVR